MNQTDIFLPFVGTMLLTLVVWIYMYALGFRQPETLTAEGHHANIQGLIPFARRLLLRGRGA